MSALKRPRYPMPEDVEQALESSELLVAYRARPDYQQNDYVGWIEQSRREVTRRKRIRQMLEELEAGDVYMKMAWNRGGKR